MHLEAVRERIAQAAERAGRKAESVRIVAVTKTHPASVVMEAVAAGLLDVGENKVQEALEKQGEIRGEDGKRREKTGEDGKRRERTGGVRWHLIGHLQRNKAKLAVGAFHLIHSLDSIRLAEALEQAAAAKDVTQDVLIQVNVAREEQKSGVALEDLDALMKRTEALSHVTVKGLMAMAPFTDDAAVIRKTFRDLKSIADCRLPIAELSMGMSQDFEIAVEEGATMLRLGTVLFGERLP